MGYVETGGEIVTIKKDMGPPQAVIAAIDVQNFLLNEVLPVDYGIRSGMNNAGMFWWTDEVATVPHKINTKKLGYKLCLEKCTEGNTEPIQAYEWIYRRLWVSNSIDEYNIYYMTVDGIVKVEETTMMPYYGPAGNWEEPIDVIPIPYWMFTLTTEDLREIQDMVELDNPDLFSQGSIGCVRKGERLYAIMSRFYPFEKIKHMRNTCYQVRDIIAEYVKEYVGVEVGDDVTPLQRAKIAKVAHDYIALHAHYYRPESDPLPDEPILGTMYSALNPANEGTICSGYSEALAWILNEFGIQCLVCSGNIVDNDGRVIATHAWNMANYVEEYGTWGDNPADWCEIDLTDDDYSDTTTQWIRFNIPFSSFPKTSNHREKVKRQTFELSLIEGENADFTYQVYKGGKKAVLYGWEDWVE